MSFSIRIGRLFGVDIRLHVLFIFLFIWLVVARSDDGLQGIAINAARYGGLFLFVLLHELGHSLVALRRGVRVIDITLWPLGGMARLARIPEDPRTELAITIAGPLVNVGIAAVLFPLLLLYRPLSALLDVQSIVGNLLGEFIAMNVIMALFNLIPAFPMDGGRILRALLARRRGYYLATKAAVRVSRVFAIAGVALAIWPGPIWYAVLAMFIWASGTQELVYSQLREVQRRAAGMDGSFPSEVDSVDSQAADGAIPMMSPERRAALEEALERLRRQKKT